MTDNKHLANGFPSQFVSARGGVNVNRSLFKAGMALETVFWSFLEGLSQ